MPPMIDTAHDDQVETHLLEREQPQAQGVRPRFWCALAHGLSTYLIPIPRKRPAPSCSTYRPFEAPMDRLVQEYASLSLLALAII
jgi:hypothetical protein